MAEVAAQFVDIAVEGVAVAEFVASPDGYHKFVSVNGLADIGGQLFQYTRFYIRESECSAVEYQRLTGDIEQVAADVVGYIG